MLARFFRWLFTSPAPARVEAVPAPLARPASFFTSDAVDGRPERMEVLDAVKSRSLRVTPSDFRTYDAQGVAMDSGASFGASAKGAFTLADANVPDSQLLWYASQSFIGFQLCAILAQQWLIDKACTIPARDAVRNGYKVGGENVTPALVARIERADKRMGLKRQLVEFVRMTRIFGIRIAVFRVESTDPKYYERPFNPDGVTPGSYRGIVQVDPYWCTPELTAAGATNPASSEFYEPLYWTIQGKRYHRSHLVISRGPEVPDILKPSYQFAGMSVPQRIYERVYAAERTANEGPQLALTKRAMVFYTDTANALANQGLFTERLQTWAQYRDNFGVKVADKEGDKIEQHDTALGDFDTVVMTQYQLVAAIANVPATKLLGTTPKGFNATGEYEEASYHEELESIQTSDMEPLLNRHHRLLLLSEGAKWGVDPWTRTTVEWPALDAPTKKEEAEIGKLHAETDAALVAAGAIDGAEVRARLVADPDSGYNGLPLTPPPDAKRADPTAGAGHPFGARDALDASEWNPADGTYAEAELITNQRFLSHDKVAEKIAHGDFLVALSPEFVTPAGKRYRVILDGHHALQAAVESGNTPEFEQLTPAASDYRNVATKLPAFGQEMEG